MSCLNSNMIRISPEILSFGFFFCNVYLADDLDGRWTIDNGEGRKKIGEMGEDKREWTG